MVVIGAGFVYNARRRRNRMGTEAKLSQISTDYIYHEPVARFLFLLSSLLNFIGFIEKCSYLDLF